VVYKNKYSFVRTYCKKKKAKEIAETFNENFKVSERWLQKFRIRHERHYFQMSLKNLVAEDKILLAAYAQITIAIVLILMILLIKMIT
jgi:hypothetical protein